MLYCRWRNIQLALDEHRRRLDGALEVHAFNRDVDDINDRINEKVSSPLKTVVILHWLIAVSTLSWLDLQVDLQVLLVSLPLGHFLFLHPPPGTH